jgi:hypothetical protein
MIMNIIIQKNLFFFSAEGKLEYLGKLDVTCNINWQIWLRCYWVRIHSSQFQRIEFTKTDGLDKEPVCTIDSSSESENEEELPDLDDYSIICISDDELYYKSVEKLSDNRSTDTEENIKKQFFVTQTPHLNHKCPAQNYFGSLLILMMMTSLTSFSAYT